VRAGLVGQWVLRGTGVAGLAIFLSVYALTWHTPQWVEDFAAEFIRAEVVEEMGQRIDDMQSMDSGSVLAGAAESLYEHNEAAIRALRSELEGRIQQMLASALAEVRDPGCTCRRIVQAWLAHGARSQLAQLLIDNGRIKSFIQSQYMKVAEDLRREIRIFTATNAFAFLLLLLLSLAKPAAARHLLLPGALLLVATLFCTCLYLFGQNWLLNLIHGDYLGWAYAAWLGVAFLLLVDIALNRGRVTTVIVNAIIEAIGGVVSALTPC
jgi:hypothetical protein